MSSNKKENVICDDENDIDWTVEINVEEDTHCQPLQTKNDKDVNTDSCKRRHEMSGVTDDTKIKKSRQYAQSKQKKQYEDDPVVLSNRQKQIDFGKNTIGYDNYIKAIPKELRKPEDPQTPNKYLKYSRRSFDVLLRNWRLQLHKYDNVFVEND